MMKIVKYFLYLNYFDDEVLCNYYFRRYELYKGIVNGFYFLLRKLSKCNVLKVIFCL